MARTADHHARRRQIRQALLQVAAREGLPRVTIPRVAAQADLSVGAVQHYYASKQLLLGDAYAALLTQVEERVDRAVAEAESRHARIEHILAEALEQLLPFDEPRLTEWRLTRSFEAMALTDGTLRPALVRGQQHLRSRVTTAIENGRLCGEVTDPGLDETLEATALLAHVSALADQCAWGTGVSEPMIRQIITQDCARLFPGPCGRSDT